MKISTSLPIMAIVFLVGCATAYQQQGLTGGFSETQLDDNVWRVSFKGNAYTSRDRAADFTLLRSAELALDNGYYYFVIVDSEKYSKNSSFTTPTQVNTYGTTNMQGQANTYGNTSYISGTGSSSSHSTITGGQTYHYSKPRQTNTIICFKERPIADGIIYNAQFIHDSLSQKYGIKPASNEVLTTKTIERSQ